MSKRKQTQPENSTKEENSSIILTENTNESTENDTPAEINSIVPRRPDARITASVRNVKLMKDRKLQNLTKQLEEKRAILKRGYHIIKKEDGTSYQLKFDSAERGFVKKDREKLKIEIYKLKMELRDYNDDLKSRVTRTVKSHQSSLSKLREKNKIRKKTKDLIKIIEKEINSSTENGKLDELRVINGISDSQEKETSLEKLLGKVIRPDDMIFVTENEEVKNRLLRATAALLKESFS